MADSLLDLYDAEAPKTVGRSLLLLRVADGGVTRGNVPSSSAQPLETMANTGYVLD